MRVSVTMEQTINQLAVKHGVDLAKPYAYMKLHLSFYMPLLVHNRGDNDLVEHYEAEVLASGLLYLELSRHGYGVLVIEEKVKHRKISVCYWLYEEDAPFMPPAVAELWALVDEQGKSIANIFQRYHPILRHKGLIPPANYPDARLRSPRDPYDMLRVDFRACRNHPITHNRLVTRPRRRTMDGGG